MDVWAYSVVTSILDITVSVLFPTSKHRTDKFDKIILTSTVIISKQNLNEAQVSSSWLSFHHVTTVVWNFGHMKMRLHKKNLAYYYCQSQESTIMLKYRLVIFSCRGEESMRMSEFAVICSLCNTCTCFSQSVRWSIPQTLFTVVLYSWLRVSGPCHQENLWMNRRPCWEIWCLYCDVNISLSVLCCLSKRGILLSNISSA